MPCPEPVGDGAPRPYYPMQIRISQISCTAAGHLAIGAINNPPRYK